MHGQDHGYWSIKGVKLAFYGTHNHTHTHRYVLLFLFNKIHDNLTLQEDFEYAFYSHYILELTWKLNPGNFIP